MKYTALYDDATEAAIRRTPEGMAHWAGTGPAGRICRECQFYSNEGRYASGSTKHAEGQLKPGRCGKYTALMQSKKGPTFPFDIHACKHFAPHPNPPSAVVKHRWK